MAIYITRGLGINEPVDITFGADPEFELIKNQCIVPALKEVTKFKAGKEIGTDGCTAILEIRPKPSTNPVETIKYMKGLIKKIYNKGYTISSKGDTYSLGGHIHIGLPEYIQTKLRIYDLVRLYDSFLGKKVSCLSGRARGKHYRKLSSFERKSYGFEYRTPPAAIFHNSVFIQLCMELMGKITEYYIKSSTISVNSSAKNSDYEVIGFQKDRLKLFKAMIVKMKEIQATRTAFENVKWGCNSIQTPKEPENIVNIEFRDEWDHDIRDYFERSLRHALEGYNVSISLFGFNRNRGMVSNIEILGWETIQWNSRPNEIGLAHEFRTNMGFFRDTVTDVISKIKSLVEGR